MHAWAYARMRASVARRASHHCKHAGSLVSDAGGLAGSLGRDYQHACRGNTRAQRRVSHDAVTLKIETQFRFQFPSRVAATRGKSRRIPNQISQKMKTSIRGNRLIWTIGTGTVVQISLVAP